MEDEVLLQALLEKNTMTATRTRTRFKQKSKQLHRGIRFSFDFRIDFQGEDIQCHNGSEWIIAKHRESRTRTSHDSGTEHFNCCPTFWGARQSTIQNSLWKGTAISHSRHLQHFYNAHIASSRKREQMAICYERCKGHLSENTIHGLPPGQQCRIFQSTTSTTRLVGK